MSRAYGWDADGRLVDDEADVLRGAAADILDGRAVSQVVKDLRDRGGTWTVGTLTRALRNPRIIGATRTRAGDLVDRADVDPILDRDDWERLTAIFDDPARKRYAPKSRSSLLTGLVRCARDDQTMVRRGEAETRCTECSSSIATTILESETAAAVLARVASPLWRAALAGALAEGGDRYRMQIADADQRMKVLAESFGSGEADRVALDAGLAAARERRARAEYGLALAEVGRHLDGISDEQLVEWWTEASLQDRRAFIMVVLDRVVVAPKTKGVPPADRISFVWR